MGEHWWHLDLSTWNDGVTFLATPLSSPHWPERHALGPPQVVKFHRIDEVLTQADLGGLDVDPLKGSGR